MAAHLRRPDPVTVLAGVVALCGLGLFSLLRDVPAPAGAPVRLPWFVFAVVVIAVERYAVHLHFRGDNHTLTLGELPIILGLFLASPSHFVLGRVVGVVVLLAVIERQKPIKVVFNGGLALLDGALAAGVWHLLGGTDDPLAVGSFVAAVVAMLLTQLTGSSLVWTVISLVQGRFRRGDLVDLLGVALPFAAANTAAALSIMALVLTNPALAWVPVIPFAVMLVAYRAYGSERRHRDTLEFLYEVARNVHRGTDAASALGPLLRSLQEHLSAAEVELTVQGLDRGRRTTFIARANGDVDVESSMPAGPTAPEPEGSTLTPGRRMTATAKLGNQALLVLSAESEISGADGFDEIGLHLVESVANLAATIVERADLEEMKTAFLSAVSHELRTPLAVVMGTATTLRHRGAQLRPDQTELLTERLEAHAHRLDKLLTDLLDIDRLARGVIEPRRRVVDVSLMASRLIDALEVTSHPVKLYGTGVRGDVDGPQVERIVENLVRNAVKYTPDGTPIEVSLQRLPEGVRILVEDRGPGVPDAAKSSILEPFVRLDANHPSPGTGIGLSLVRRFAQLHGGDIEVSDRPGGGATFSVLLTDDRPDLLSAPTAPAAGGAVVQLRPIA